MSAREELLAQARQHMWAAWQLSSEELASQAASTLLGLGMLVPEGGAAELERYRAAFEAQQARAETLDGLLRTAQDRITELESRLAEYERPADEDPIANALTETAPLTVYRASHDSIVMGLYITREAARDHCQKLMERASVAALEWRRDGEWREDDDGEPGPDEAEELYEYGTHPETATWEPTGYVVTPLEVAAAYDPDGDE